MKTLTRSLTTIIACGLLVTVTACAAKGVRNQTRVGALSVGEAALAIDAAERQVAAGNIPAYDAAAQKQVGAGVLKVLHAARAYERAAASWKDGEPIPQTLADAKVGLALALTDLSAVIPQAEAVRGPMLKAIDVLKAALAAGLAMRDVPPVQNAQLPAGVMSLLALANLIGGLVSSGRTSYDRIKALLQKEGATDEELTALDLSLSDAIARREAEQGGA